MRHKFKYLLQSLLFIKCNLYINIYIYYSFTKLKILSKILYFNSLSLNYLFFVFQKEKKKIIK